MRFWAVAILCTIPPFAIGTFYVYICIFVEVDNTYGIKYFNVLCTGVTIAIGLVVQFVYGRCCSSLRDDEDDDEVRILHKPPWPAPSRIFLTRLCGEQAVGAQSTPGLTQPLMAGEEPTPQRQL